MIYKEFTVSKTGSKIAVFSDGTLSSSKYNPEREAQNFGNDIDLDTGYFIIGGIAGGHHILSLSERFPDAFFLCVEEDEDSLAFCLENESLKYLLSKQNYFFCTSNDIEKYFTGTYIPSVHNNFAFLPLRSWKDKTCCYENLVVKIQKSLKTVSADYSVQCHFGKIWQRNILENLKFLSEHKDRCSFDVSEKDVSKTAAIIAAGPSLDFSVEELIQHRNDYFIFSTDTTYGSLLKRNIIPDAVVSIDGQHISASHFYDCKQNTQFIFDLCSNPSAVKKVYDKGNNYYFFTTGHPLGNLACQFDNFSYISSGSGTVTIAACDFALKSGFKKIKFFGSDFCYSSGKPYTKGTYLDNNFYVSSHKTGPAENSFVNLMFRTEIKSFSSENFTYSNLINAFTTDVLDSYKETLKQWLFENNADYYNGTYLFRNNINAVHLSLKTFDFINYINFVLNTINTSIETADISKINFVLPYFAFEKSKISKTNKFCLKDFLKLENTYFKRYTY